jgi:Flp pilus assembly pilin Flp
MPATLQNPSHAPARRGLVGASRRRGTSAVEYALILGLVACGVGVGVVQFGPALDQTYAAIERAVATVAGLGGAAPQTSALTPPAPPPTGGGPGRPGSGPSGGGGGTTSF